MTDSTASRKDLKRAYKEATVPAGIWIIRNKANGKVLLGEALNLASRLNRHRFALEQRSHECRELQADWDRQGAGDFSFETAELLQKPADNPYFDVPGELKRLEAFWLDDLNPYAPVGYHGTRPA